MKVMQELITNSSEAAVATHSVNLTRSENDLSVSEMAVQNALVARSSRAKMSLGETTDVSSVDGELEAVMSGKFLGDIADGLGSVGGVLRSVGMTVGSPLANAVTVVGDKVVAAAETSLESLPGPIQNAANSIGDVAVRAVTTVVSHGEMVAASTVDLAGTALAHAQQSLAEMERLAAGLASGAWNEIKKIVDCLKEKVSLCSILIGDQCDCGQRRHSQYRPLLRAVCLQGKRRVFAGLRDSRSSKKQPGRHDPGGS